MNRAAIRRGKLRKVRRREAVTARKRAYRTPHNRARRALKARQRANVRRWFEGQVGATLADVFHPKNLQGEARLARVGKVRASIRYR